MDTNFKEQLALRIREVVRAEQQEEEISGTFPSPDRPESPAKRRKLGPPITEESAWRNAISQTGRILEHIPIASPEHEETLDQFVDRLETDAVCCCSGSIPIIDDTCSTLHENEYGGFRVGSGPVTIRWDVPTASKLQFPPGENIEKIFEYHHGSLDVDGIETIWIDALDDQQFSTNFCPHELGIINTISKILLPGMEWTEQKPAFGGVDAPLVLVPVLRGLTVSWFCIRVATLTDLL